MKMKTILKTAIAAAAVTSALILAGCGGDSTSTAAKSRAGSAKTYVVATRGTSKPLSYVDDKNVLTGFEPELLREIEKRDPTIHFEFKPMAVDAAFVAMDAGQVDLIANQMRRSPSREQKYLITSEPNNYSVRRLVVKDNRDDIHSLQDLAGKKVAVTTNSEFKNMVEEFNASHDNKITAIYTDKGPAETINLVATGRADAAGEYEYTANLARTDRKLPVKTVGDVLAVVPTYYIIKKDDAHQELVDKLNKALKSMREDGTLKRISEKYLGADYSADPSKK